MTDTPDDTTRIPYDPAVHVFRSVGASFQFEAPRAVFIVGDVVHNKWGDTHRKRINRLRAERVARKQARMAAERFVAQAKAVGAMAFVGEPITPAHGFDYLLLANQPPPEPPFDWNEAAEYNR